MKQNKALAFETEQCKNATEEQSSQGNLPVGQSGEPPLPASNGHSRALPQSLRRGTSAESQAIKSVATVRLSIYAASTCGPNWRDEIALITVTETQAESLRALAMIAYRGRRKVTHAVLIEGVSMAAVRAALRQHVRNSLPVAEDNSTVRIADGCNATYEHTHTPAWADGRMTPEELTARIRETVRRNGL